MVAGDDVVVWVKKDKLDDFRFFLPNYFNDRSDSPIPSGLGQCVKSFKVGPWYDFDFCSKLSIYTGDNWYLM